MRTLSLNTLLTSVPELIIRGDLEAVSISSLALDSRKVIKDSLFFALPGTQENGNAFVKEAIEKGASAIVSESPPLEKYARKNFPWVQAKDPREAMAYIAGNFYDNPSEKLKTIAVTGTNGKSSVAFLANHLIRSAWTRCGSIGTLGYDTFEAQYPASHTTPESPTLQKLLNEMHDHGCRAAVMEASSHAIAQKRVAQTFLDAAIFTNLSQDHLDYHETMEAYFLSKQALFTNLHKLPGNKKPTFLINKDDSYGKRLLEYATKQLSAKTLSFGFSFSSDYLASDPQMSLKETQFKLQHKNRSLLVRLPLLGHFNIYNALAALSACQAIGLNLREAVQNLLHCPQIPGRLENVSQHSPFPVFVDYAHTPDALEKTLETLRKLSPKRLITVFGCGGDRDRSKRPLMAAVAEKFSDHAILTSDNPRSENPRSILNSIETGFRGSAFTSIENRREAIAHAISLAQEGDTVLIAGKGHETYQIIGDKTLDFDDRVEARYALQDLHHKQS